MFQWIWDHTLPTTLKGLSRHPLADYRLLMFIFKNFLASIILKRLIDENFLSMFNVLNVSKS